MEKIDIEMIFEWPLWLQSLLMLPICFIIFYLFYFFDYANLNQKLVQAQQQETDLKQQLDLLFTQEVKLDNELKRLPILQAMLVEWKKKLTSYSKLPNVLDEVLKLGTVDGVVFSEVSPGDAVKEGNYSKIPIKILAQGEYHQLSRFIAAVANMPWLLVVNSLSMTKPQESTTKEKTPVTPSNSKNKLNGEILLDVYYLPGDA